MGIVSAIANLFKSAPKNDGARPSDFRGQGTGGTQEIGGYLISSERNSQLATLSSRTKVFDEITLNTAIVATGLRYFAALITGVNWTVTAAKDVERKGDVKKGEGDVVQESSEKAKLYAKLCEKVMHNMEDPFYRVVRNASQFRWVGFSVQEMIAERMDWIHPGLIGIGCVENRPQKTFEKWNIEPQSNKVLGWEQRDPNEPSTYELDRDRCIYIVDDTLTNSPDGVGLLRHVVKLVNELKRLEQLEMWTYETDLRGVPLAYAPTAMLDNLVKTGQLERADADAKLEGIRNFIINHVKNPQLGLLLDSSPYTGQDATRTPSSQKMWGLDLLKGQGVGLAEIHQAIERKQHEIARALGIEQFMLGAASKGSLALSEDKSRNLLELINSTISEIAWCLQRDYVGKIFELNAWDRKYMPTLMPDAVALRSISVIAEVLSKLSLAGATIDRNDPVINQVRRILKLVDQPFVTEEMKMETKAPNSGGKPGEKSPNKPTEKKDNFVERLSDLVNEFREAA